MGTDDPTNPDESNERFPPWLAAAVAHLRARTDDEIFEELREWPDYQVDPASLPQLISAAVRVRDCDLSPIQVLAAVAEANRPSAKAEKERLERLAEPTFYVRVYPLLEMAARLSREAAMTRSLSVDERREKLRDAALALGASQASRLRRKTTGSLSSDVERAIDWMIGRHQEKRYSAKRWDHRRLATECVDGLSWVKAEGGMPFSKWKAAEVAYREYPYREYLEGRRVQDAGPSLSGALRNAARMAAPTRKRKEPRAKELPVSPPNEPYLHGEGEKADETTTQYPGNRRGPAPEVPDAAPLADPGRGTSVRADRRESRRLRPRQGQGVGGGTDLPVNRRGKHPRREAGKVKPP
jgi:hypothetical protein